MKMGEQQKTEPKISFISAAEAEKEMAQKKRAGKWKDLLAQVKKEKKSAKVEGLTRGQIASLYRACEAEKLEYRTNYKEGYIVISAPK